MNLNPRTWFGGLLQRGHKFTNTGGTLAASERNALGPWSPLLGQFLPRQINPWLYEAVREAIPIIDGGIGRLVTLDGIVRVRGASDALVAEIEDWMQSVPVNDAEAGLQALYSSQGNEVYEQGVSLAEFVVKGRDIVGLRVADSKGIAFTRDAAGLHAWYRPPGHGKRGGGDGYDTVESVLRRGLPASAAMQGMTEHGYSKLARERLIYVVNEPEADNPYGTSKLRSLEFVSQLLLKIQNAMGRAWERYGDPPLHLVYKTKTKLDPAELKEREKLLSDALAKAMKARAAGNSVDLVNALGALDELSINVIGANGLVMEVEVPAKHLLEQVVAKFGLPPWMLGLQWSTSERLAEQQSIVVLQESATRFERRRPGLTRVVETMLRLRGRTWRRGDWELYQELPNLHDEMKRAQAEFLRAQTAMMGQGVGEAVRGIDNNLRAPRQPGQHKHAGDKAHGDDEHPAEPWAENDPSLPRIEAARTAEQLSLWDGLRRAVIDSLGLTPGAAGKASGEGWRFDPAKLPELVRLGLEFYARSTRPDAPALAAMWEAWARGYANGGTDVGIEAAVGEAHARVHAALRDRGLELVRNATARAYDRRIVGELASGAYDGMHPDIVARQLRAKFDAGEYDWERLVRSEMAMAQSDGKLAAYGEFAADRQFDFITAAAGVCPTCIGLAAAGPYALTAVPVPVRDSHPGCRCTVGPHVPAR